MVRYENSKLISIGIKDHEPTNKSIYATTILPSLFIADIRRKYKAYKEEKPTEIHPIFELINNIGISNITIKVVSENLNVKNKNDLNKVLLETRDKFIPQESIIKDNNTEISATTQKRYADNLKIIMRELDTTDNKFYKNPSTLEYIKQLPKSISTKKNYLSAILSVIPDDNDKTREPYLTLLHSLIKDLMIKVDKQEPKSNTDYKTINELIDCVRKQKTGDEITENYVIGLFYCGKFFAPYRLKEVYTMKISNFNKNTDNYIDIKNRVFVLNDYKTHGVYGKIIQAIPEQMFNIIDAYTSKNKNESGYLFVSSKGLPYDQTWFSRKVKSIFDLSVDDIRSSYLMELNNAGRLNTEEQKNKVAVEMRNSPSVFKYYLRVGEPIPDEIADEIADEIKDEPSKSKRKPKSKKEIIIEEKPKIIFL